MKLQWAFTGLLLAAVAGCSTEEREYQVAIKNACSRPLTMWTVKEYGPAEPGWFSPEQLAMQPDAPIDEKLPRRVLLPGEAAITRTPLVGEFDKRRGRAYVRIYEGTPTLSEMLAIDKGTSRRLDILLQPGPNGYVVDDKYGFIAYHKARPTTQAVTPR